MRILHFLDCTGHGGDALAALLIAAAQQSAGHQVELLIGQSEHSALFVERARRMQVPARRLDNIQWGYQAFKERLWVMSRTLFRIRRTVLHYHTGNLYARTPDTIACRLAPFSARLITAQSAYDWPMMKNAVEEKPLWRKDSRAFDRIVVPSAFSVAVQLDGGIPKEKVFAVPNPICVADIDKGERRAVRDEYRIAESQVLILFLARLDTVKNPLDVIDAFIQVAPRFPAAILFMVGVGEHDALCRQRVADADLKARVIFTGYRVDVANFLAAADIFIHPSLVESFGMALLEAMAARLPVITTPVGIIRDLADRERFMRLVPTGNVPALANALTSLLASPELRRQLGDAARAVSVQFDAARVAELYLQQYRAAMA